MVNLNEFAEGALAERFNEELRKVLDNIADPNTDPSKNRTVTITVQLHGDDQRDIVNASVIAKSKLLHAKEVQTKLLMDADGEGNVVGRELKSGIKGQTYLDDNMELREDTGEKVHKVINLREQGESK